MAEGTLKDIEMRLKFDGNNCDINLYWYPSNNFDQKCIALMTSSLLDETKYNPVLGEFLEQGEIRRFDANGTLIDNNLVEADIKAMNEFPSGDTEKRDRARSHAGQTQGFAYCIPTNQAAGIDFLNQLQPRLAFHH